MSSLWTEESTYTSIRMEKMEAQPMVTIQPQAQIAAQQPVGVICSQPKGPKVEWSSGLFECFTDLKSCALGTFCTGPFFCCLAHRMGESCCIAFVQGGFWAMRSAYRERHNIEGTMCSDCCSVSCCAWCTVCQLSREMDHHGYPEKYCCC